MDQLIAQTVTPELYRQVDAEISETEVERHIRYLCEEIGVRMPGTSEERQAAEYCAGQIQELGFEVETEEISYLAWAADDTRVEMVSPEAKPLPATWFSYTLPTPPDGIVAPVAYVGMEHEEDWTEAAGRIAIIGRTVTTSPGRRELIGRAQAAGAVGYLEFVTAIPSELPKVGNASSTLTGRRSMTPADLPPLPAASIAMDAVSEICAMLNTGTRPTLRLVVGPKDGDLQVWRTSPNIIGTVPGTDLSEEIVYVIAHHDANVIGAHDNASGVSALLAMARWLKESGYQPRRTIRLFLPGCEQFGLVGSTMHVLKNPEIMKRTVFAMDWGAIGDGDAMWIDRTPDTATLFDRVLEVTGYADRIPTITQPPAVASDHAGFLWQASIPACELHFREFHYLFTLYDDPEHINMDRARQSAVLGILAALGFADQGALPLDFVRCAVELRQTVQELPPDLADVYRRDELMAVLDDLEVVGQQVNAIAIRVNDAEKLDRLNQALLNAAHAVDARVTGEFKLLPRLQRGLTDHQQIASIAKKLPRRLMETSDMLTELNVQLETLAAEVDAEAVGVVSALDEATRLLREASSDLS